MAPNVKTDQKAVSSNQLDVAVRALASFALPESLTARISGLERQLASRTREDVRGQLQAERIDGTLLRAALTVKQLAGRINDIVHAVGMLVSLPYVLHPGERIQSLSLAAGNTGRTHDLETDRQIAEFKFIAWRGGAESIRQNTLFVDLFNLATADTNKPRRLYVVGKQEPLRFLNNRRAVASVLSKHSNVSARFRKLNGEQFSTVCDYYATVRDLVEIVDLAEIVPDLGIVERLSGTPGDGDQP